MNAHKMFTGRLHLRQRKPVSQSLLPWTRPTGPRFHFSCKTRQHATETQSKLHSGDHVYYNYTSGRWLYNEAPQLMQRYLQFNFSELCKILAESVGQCADDIKQFNKIAEGGSYRIFEATFQDSSKVIARLPYPCSMPRKYGIASEVATMEFLRLHGIPTPRVFDWSATSANSIGSEYMIMERVEGEELESTWYTMSVKERLSVMQKIVDLERKLFAIEFPANGSIYFDSSLEEGIDRVEIATLPNVKDAPRFCIGPSTEYLWWYQNRSELGIHGGPWKSTEQVLTATGERELAWLKKFGKLRYPREPHYREIHGNQLVDPNVQMRNLSDYLMVAACITPDEPELNESCIRHPDLSPNNIFISKSGEITGLIDWEHSVVLPLFLQAKIPKHFQNYGDEDSENFKRPSLPDNFESLTGVEKDAAAELYRRRQVHYFYVGHTNELNPTHFFAMRSHDLVMRNRLYDAACRPWEGDNVSLKAELIRVSKMWPMIASDATEKAHVTVAYSDAEMEEYLALDEKQRVADSQMQKLRDFIGVNIDGWTPNSLYDEAVVKEKLVKQQMMDAADTEDERKGISENWPFQDHEEID